MIHTWIMQHLPVISIALTIAPMFIVLGLRGYVYLATGKFRYPKGFASCDPWGDPKTAPGYRDATEVPEKPVAIVFGAGVWADGTPSPMLADRIRAAVELYQLRRVKKLLMSGDRSSPDYDEVTVMQGYAENLGIPTADILLDYAGFSTYETCHRAQKIFGITEAVLVTKNFHLPRAVYTCRQMGVEAIGLGTRDWGWIQLSYSSGNSSYRQSHLASSYDAIAHNERLMLSLIPRCRLTLKTTLGNYGSILDKI